MRIPTATMPNIHVTSRMSTLENSAPKPHRAKPYLHHAPCITHSLITSTANVGGKDFARLPQTAVVLEVGLLGKVLRHATFHS